MKKTFRDLRRIINANFFGGINERHVVLTYAHAMFDYMQANRDFKQFWTRFIYHYPNCEYLKVIEPQANKRWHIHVLIRGPTGQALYIDFDQLRSLWGLGRVHVSDLPAADNYGAYFSARFTDIDALEDSDQSEKNLNSKLIVKGARLQYYPPKFKFYTCSKGIVKPPPTIMKYGDAMNLVEGVTKVHTFTTQILMVDERGHTVELNATQYEQYNRKR